MPRLLAATLFLLFSCAVLPAAVAQSNTEPGTPTDDASAAAAEDGTPATADDAASNEGDNSDRDFAIGQFELNSAADLASVCGLSKAHPDYDSAHAFCVGYVTGAIHYYRAIADGPGMGAFLCSDRPIPRDALVNAFLQWSKANPQMASAPAVENLMRAAAAQWPCSG